MNVSNPQPNQFRCTKSCLDCRREQRVVASANPSRSVWCRKKRVDFRISEKAHKATRETLRWNRKYVLDDFRMLRMTKGDRKSTRLNSSHLGISYAVFC